MSTEQTVDQIRYEVVVQEDPETGDLLLPIPQPLLDALNWKEGTDVKFEIDAEGTVYLLKADQ